MTVETVLRKCAYMRKEDSRDRNEHSVIRRLSFCSFTHSSCTFFFLPKGKSDTFALHLLPGLLVTRKCERTGLPKRISLPTLLMTTDFCCQHTSLTTLSISFPSLCSRHSSPEALLTESCIFILY